MIGYSFCQDVTISCLVLVASQITEVCAAILTARAATNDGVAASNYFAETANKHCEISESFTEDNIALILITYPRL